MSDNLLEKIKSRGYWHVLIRPLVFREERISNLSEIISLIEKNEVRFRGWNFPHMRREELVRGVDHIGMNISFMDINESWRFFQSGQFAWFRGFSEDWYDGRDGIRSTFDGEPGAFLSILSTLFQLSEIYEFVSRLAQDNIFDEQLHLTIKLVGTKNRQLFFWPSSGRWLRAKYTCTVESLPRENTYQVLDFIGRSRDYSYQHFLWLMERFGFEPSPDVFKDDQEKLFEGRF